ncbi:MAG: carbon monoxide dehydrogenase subunit G [Chloroflexi bacterium]|nr:carbon monoxide dehydrogenase subunit G [Chloroflexota bacterium]
MKLEGSYVFEAPRERVWALLMSSDALKQCIPGCESLEADGEDSFKAVMKVGVASIRGTYNGRVRMTDKQEPESYTLNVEGSGGPGFVRGAAKVTLMAEGQNTHLIVDADGQVGGTVAGVGQRMLGGVAKMLMNQFFDCLRKQV